MIFQIECLTEDLSNIPDIPEISKGNPTYYGHYLRVSIATKMNMANLLFVFKKDMTIIIRSLNLVRIYSYIDLGNKIELQSVTKPTLPYSTRTEASVYWFNQLELKHLRQLDIATSSGDTDG